MAFKFTKERWKETISVSNFSNILYLSKGYSINMSENSIQKEEQPVKTIFVTNKNYEKYYNKLKREEDEKKQKLKEKRKETTRLTAASGQPRPLLQTEIEEIQKVAKSAKECAKLLGVSYPTYKKYAKLYGVFDKCINQSGAGIPKHGSGRLINGKTQIERLLNGEMPNFPNWKLKKRLLESGYLPKCCANCGYDEERVFDGKTPLLMDYLDGNKRNHKWDNLRLLCYNCWFQINGDLFGRAMRNVKRDVWDYQYIHK